MTKKRLPALFGAIFFTAFLFAMGIWTAIAPDPDFVVSERRAATPIPDSIVALGDTENYLLDSFPLKDACRRFKNRFTLYILRFSDVDGYFLTENGTAKDLSPVKAELAASNAAFFERITSTYFPQSQSVYYALVPDKAYYAREAGTRLDYDALAATLRHKEGYIDLTDTLTLGSYYATDIHWKTEALFPTARLLAEAMRFTPPEGANFQTVTLGAFTGTLGAQAGLSGETDDLVLLDPAIDCTVTYPDGSTGGIFAPSLYDSSYDKYDVFLRGEVVGSHGNFCIRIQNKENESGRKLILFRDSFARSLVPFLLHAYSEIVLVDLRAPFYRYEQWAPYLSANDSTDILFLVSTHTYNFTKFQ